MINQNKTIATVHRLVQCLNFRAGIPIKHFCNWIHLLKLEQRDDIMSYYVATNAR